MAKKTLEQLLAEQAKLTARIEKMQAAQKAAEEGAKMVEKTNLMTGKKFMQRADTPRSCDPSTELYWTM